MDEVKSESGLLESEEKVQEQKVEAPKVNKLRFSGTGYHSLDEKNRVKFPSEIRSQLGNSAFRLARGARRRIYVYTTDVANDILDRAEEKLKDRDLPEEIVRDLRKYVASFTPEVEVDSQGRFLIPQEFMRFARLDKKEQLVTIGFLNHFEIWKASDWDDDDDDDDGAVMERALPVINER